MKIGSQLKQLQDAAAEWAKANPASIALAATIEEMLTQLALQTPAGNAAIVILFHSEKKREPYEESGMVDRVFWILIAMPRGMKADASARLTEGAAGAKPLYEVAEDFRERVIRAAKFSAETTEVTPDYKGMEPFTWNGQTATDTLKLEFWIGVQMPAVSAQ